MLTPEILLETDVNHVDVPECSKQRLPKSMDIPNACKKSGPRIGLDTCAIMKINAYNFPPILISRRSFHYALIGVPFATINRNSEKFIAEVVEEGGQRETCEPVSSRQRLRDRSSTTSPRFAGRDLVGPAALGDRPMHFPKPCPLARSRHRGSPRREERGPLGHCAGDPHSTASIRSHTSLRHH